MTNTQVRAYVLRYDRGGVLNMAKKSKPKKERDDVLDPQEEAFALHFVECFNRTQAAKRSGYSADSAHVLGCRLLKKVKVQQRVDELLAEMKGDSVRRKQRMLRELDAIAFTDLNDVIHLDTGEEEIDEDLFKAGENGQLKPAYSKVQKPYRVRDASQMGPHSRAIAEIQEITVGPGVVSRKVKFHDKVRAMELAAKIDGTIKPTTQKHEHTNPDGSLKPVHRVVFMIPPNGRVKGK